MFKKQFHFLIPPVSSGSVRIAISNHSMFTNYITVFLVASFRTMSGKLIERRRIDFDESDVLILNIPECLNWSRAGL